MNRWGSSKAGEEERTNYETDFKSFFHLVLSGKEEMTQDWAITLFLYVGSCESCCWLHVDADVSSRYWSHFLQVYSQKWTNLGEGNGTPFQYSCLENTMDRGDWWAAVHGVAKSRT